MTVHVVMTSGGIGSWATSKRAETYMEPGDRLVNLFADVKGDSTEEHVGEDEDTYRFLADAAAKSPAEFVRVADGRTIWEVFRDDRFLGNSRLANCSKFLKQIPSRTWLEENCDPDDTIVYVGIDWTEMHRIPAIEKGYLPWRTRFPMTEAPYLDKDAMIAWAKAEGIDPPRAYALGFAHNNCGGGCVRSGQGQFKNLHEINPPRYARWEQGEADLREHLGKDVAILNDRTVQGRLAAQGLSPDDVYTHRRYEDDVAGELRLRADDSPVTLRGRVPLPLTVLRQRIEGDGEVDDLDIGGCGCFLPFDEEPVA